jgi:hypothetical protein
MSGGLTVSQLEVDLIHSDFSSFSQTQAWSHTACYGIGMNGALLMSSSPDYFTPNVGRCSPLNPFDEF